MLDERSESIDEPNVNSVMAMVLIGPSIVRPVGRKWTMSQSDDEDEASEPAGEGAHCISNIFMAEQCQCDRREHCITFILLSVVAERSEARLLLFYVALR